MKKILIVSLKAGAGHLKAAQAIEKALKIEYPNFEIKNIDLLDYVTVLSKEFYSNWYLDIANKAPQFYAWLYNRLDSSSKDIRILSDRLNAQEFQNLIDEYNPDLIFCTHFVPANLLTVWREKYKLNFKIILTLTDYEAHKLWVDNQVDLYTVASDYVKDQLVEFGADEEKIKITGIQIDLKFSHLPDRSEIIKKLDLKNQFTISIFAGAFGVGPLKETFSKIAKIEENFQIIAIAGKNKELFNDFQMLAQNINKPIKIYGFVDNMDEIMVASDIAISKAGGLTVSECLAAGLPLIISHPFPGQEEANARYLVNHQAAYLADKPEEIVEIIRNVLKNPQSLKEMREKIIGISKPNAALEIAKIASTYIN